MACYSGFRSYGSIACMFVIMGAFPRLEDLQERADGAVEAGNGACGSAALEKIFREGIGLNEADAKTATDIYFKVARLEEREVADYSTQVRIPTTRAGIIDFMEQHGFVEGDIDRIATETSVDSLADLENLALKHEIQRNYSRRVGWSRAGCLGGG